jgi:hypothetical protein
VSDNHPWGKVDTIAGLAINCGPRSCYVRCDGCVAVFDPRLPPTVVRGADNPTRLLSRQLGWTGSDDQDFCPECSIAKRPLFRA